MNEGNFQSFFNKISLMLAMALCILICPFVACAAEEVTIPASDNVSILATRYPATGNYLMVWIAPEYGFRTGHREMARQLAQQGIEVWQTDIVDSLFLPQGTASIKQLDGTYVADVVEYAHQATGKKIVVTGDSYATTSALIGAHAWQQRKISKPYFIGAVLFSPYTYAYIPQLGVSPEFMPVVSASNIPMMIYQATQSGVIRRFDQLVETLQQHGSPVYFKYIPDVMSLFYQVPPTRAMQEQAGLLPAHIKQMIALLEKHPVPNTPPPLPQANSARSNIDIALREFQGQHRPFVIDLESIDGTRVVMKEFAGKITVINFWATWCPPCVEEIPSLNRLAQKMADSPFELISINYAEDRSAILEFMQRVDVQFPILLDSDGKFAHSLNIVAFPSTFILDTKGVVRYGVNAAIEWDSPELISKLKALQ